MSLDVAVVNNDAGGGDAQIINGTSNGHHSSSNKHKSSKDKHRDKDREHKSSSSREHKSSSNRDKEKHSSSSSSGHKDKHRDGKSHHSGSSSSHRDKDKDKERSDKDKHRSSSSSHHKSSSSSSSKDKERSKDKTKDRERKESSSSSSSKDKNRHHKSSGHDKDRHHHSSSSSSSKHRHSSSSSKPSSSSTNNSTSYKHKTEDGFVKPEPLSQPPPQIVIAPTEFSNGFLQNGILPGSNGHNISNGSNGNSYKDDKRNSLKKELWDQNFDVSQASSCDYSMSQFRDDEPNFVVKEEATMDGDDSGERNQLQMNSTQDENMEVNEEDIPLAMRQAAANIRHVKKEEVTDDEEDIPLLERQKMKKEQKKEKKQKEKEKEKKLKRVKVEIDYEDVSPKKKPKKQTESSVKQETVSPTKRKKKDEEEVEVWKWWEEEKRDDGVKWNTLEHRGPVFAPPYERVPKNVHFYYDGKPMELSQDTEEAATFYAKMLNHDYCTKEKFNENFFTDFRKSMNSKEREIIKNFKKCNFMEMHKFFLAESEKRKAASKEEKERRKQENEELIKEYGFCWIDGHKERIGNFRLEPPGLFRGRGDHPKMGKIKRRIRAEDISINCSKNSKIPAPPKSCKWKDVRHDNTVTWLASWVENVQGQVKYIMLNPSSKLKGEKDHVKYETARKLDKCINKIRNTYREEWKSKEMRVRQRAVALYFIDKLALRAGNEKDEDQADTVGCCSLRVEHVKLHKELNGKEFVVVFDFLGKDSIRYYNEVEVEKRVFKNLELFMENKKDDDDLFDRLNTQVLNEHLKELMDGLTAKVFRTYNASITLQNQLDLLTKDDMSVEEKLLAYNRANRAVAILCNHQRAVPKSHEKSMENLKEKIKTKRDLVDDTEAELNELRKLAKRGSAKEKMNADKKSKQLDRLKQQLKKLELQETDRDENKTIALGTSKLNYLDPRISVAWCKKNNVPIEKIFNKTQRTKFMWAIHMADENYRF